MGVNKVVVAVPHLPSHFPDSADQLPLGSFDIEEKHIDMMPSIAKGFDLRGYKDAELGFFPCGVDAGYRENAERAVDSGRRVVVDSCGVTQDLAVEIFRRPDHRGQTEPGPGPELRELAHHTGTCRVLE